MGVERIVCWITRKPRRKRNLNRGAFFEGVFRLHFWSYFRKWVR
jgi:hypothetical protein